MNLKHQKNNMVNNWNIKEPLAGKVGIVVQYAMECTLKHSNVACVTTT